MKLPVTARQVGQYRRKLGENSIAAFAQLYFPEYLKAEVPPFHKEIYKAIEQGKDMALAAPREHAKSTICSEITPAWHICYRTKKFILITSETSDQAKGFLRNIIAKLEQDGPLKHDFGNLAGNAARTLQEKKKWTESEIITTNGVKIVAKGRGAAIRGLRYGEFRPDLVIADDIEDENSVATAAQRRKTRKWYFTSLINVGGPDCQYITIGTYLHHDCLIKRLVEGDKYGELGWWRKKYKAFDGDKPIFPGLWSKERLAKRKKAIGSGAFSQEFLNQPILDEAQPVKPGWIIWERRPIVEKGAAWTIGTEPLKTFMAVDPAISQKETADYFAYSVLGQNGIKRYDLEAFRRRGMTIEEQATKIVETALKWKPIALGIEVTAYQMALKQVVEIIAKKYSIPLPIVELRPDKDKIRRMRAVTPLIENGHVLFRNQELVDDILDFPVGAHDDLADAFVSCLGLTDTRESTEKLEVFGEASDFQFDQWHS